MSTDTTTRSEYRPRPSTVEAYTMGDCWHLALILHRMTGWPFLFTAPAGVADDINDPDYWEHVAVLLPDGRVLDIEGANEREAWLERWGRGQRVVTDEATASSVMTLSPFGLREEQLRIYSTDTRRVASRLLAVHGGRCSALPHISTP